MIVSSYVASQLASYLIIVNDKCFVTYTCDSIVVTIEFVGLTTAMHVQL